MDRGWVEVAIGLAALAIVVAVGSYIAEHITCVHIPYIIDSCTVTK